MKNRVKDKVKDRVKDKVKDRVKDKVKDRVKDKVKDRYKGPLFSSSESTLVQTGQCLSHLRHTTR